ncbi:MAG: hypothetical protein HOV94_13970 [Saccharothrix sp.]|nr:hypothetical protein [Saccharothrix sp.]
MTTTMILLGGTALLALLGYLAATGRVADSRDGRDWKRGSAPAGGAGRTPDPASDTAADSVSADEVPALRRKFTTRQVELTAVGGDHDGRGSVLSR